MSYPHGTQPVVMADAQTTNASVVAIASVKDTQAHVVDDVATVRLVEEDLRARRVAVERGPAELVGEGTFQAFGEVVCAVPAVSTSDPSP